MSVGLAFVVQWVVFIPAFIQQTEKFFDITGSITYISITSFALFSVTNPQPRSFLLWAVVLVWAIQYGWVHFSIAGYTKRAKMTALTTSNRLSSVS